MRSDSHVAGASPDAPASTRALLKQLHRFFRGARLHARRWPEAHVHKALPHFQVVEISPGARNASWVYVTAGLSGQEVPADKRCEFLLHAEHADSAHVRLLCLLAWFHLTGETLGIGQVMEIGEPWVPGSILDRLLVCRLHLHPEIEVIRPKTHHAHVHWVLPLSPWEHAYLCAHGLDALEELFAARRIEFANPFRHGCI